MVAKSCLSCVMMQLLTGGGGNFLSRLSSFPIDSLNEETVELLQAYLQSDEELELKLATRTCGTFVAGLHAWTHALCSYYSVNKKVIHTKVD